jgi:hypothetical protein
MLRRIRGLPCLLLSLCLLGSSALCEAAVQVNSRLLGKRSLQLPPDRPLNLVSHCNFANETGYRGESVVEVREGVVHSLHTIVDVPELGRCEFMLDGMKQTRIRPNVELRHRQHACVVRMWEQGPKATVSFSNCASACANPEAFKYVWPLLINRDTGHCD